MHKRDARMLGKYRAIIKLPPVSKFIEKSIAMRLENFFNKLNLLINWWNLFINFLDHRFYSKANFFDLTLKFDCVNIEVIISRLELLGIQEN